MKALRQILRVSWTERKTNDWVLQKAGTEAQLLQSIRKRKLSYYGHILRKKGSCMEKELIQGTTSAQRKRGRPRMTWEDNIKKWTGLDNGDLLQSVEDRRNWRMIVHKAANPRTEDGWRQGKAIWCIIKGVVTLQKSLGNGECMI